MLILKYRKVSGVYIALVVIYVLLVLLVTPDTYLTAAFRLGVAHARILSLLVAVPYLAVWLLALRAYAGLRWYAEAIQSSDEWYAYHLIAQGMLYAVFFLPVAMILNELTAYVQAVHLAIFSSAVLFSNLIIVGVGLTAFVYVYAGSVQLLRLAKIRPQPSYLATSAAFIFFAVLYVVLSFHRPGTVQIPTYSILTFPNYESDILSDILILLPRLAGWFLGILTALNLYRYSRHVQGVIYREAFKRVWRGMAIIILGAVIFRSAQAVPVQLERPSVELLLFVSYLVLLVFGIGFGLLTSGAQELHKIERVNG